MVYEVRKGGEVYFHTEYDNCRPDSRQEADMQKYGYEIYIDGKKLRRVKT